MEITTTTIAGLIICNPKPFTDDRGFFMELYNQNVYASLGITETFVQDNISVSRKGVVRGLHFQNDPHAQAKLVSVLQGAVLDVAVDIRKDSPTFGKHIAIELSGENKKQFFIPKGFAHGFIALEENTVFSYKCSDIYNKESESGILWNDEALGINWGDGEKIVSEKDSLQQTFSSYKESVGIK